VVSHDGLASRRALLTAAAGAGAAALAGCASATTATIPTPEQAVKTLSSATMEADVEMLTAALVLERRTVAAYIAGIPLLPRPQAKAAEKFLSEELEHTGELISLIKDAGGMPQPRPNSFDLGHPTDAVQVVALLHQLETMQIAGYLRMIPRLSPGPVRAAVATILTVDSQHVSMLRLVQGQNPVPAAFVTGSE
jgi:hypothetical protein